MSVEVIEKGKKIPKGARYTLKAGIFENSKYSNGAYIAEVAFWNEFGTTSKNGEEHIPPRPFMRNVTDDKAKMERLAKIAKIEIEKGVEGEAVANTMGEVLVTMIKQSIQTGTFTPNAPSTIAKKGSSRPLIWNGDLLGSITFKVDKR